MGKLDKKKKFDRINTLRKQYDAFLEEEKKRKERNDFILGKLDKIRSCTAVVQIRRKPVVSGVGEQETSNFPSRLWEYETQFSRPHIEQSLKLPVQFTSDTLLSEITKRYILIPKLRMGADNECIVTNNSVSDNIDWKSKYDILNQLKQDEKEDLSESKNIKTQFNYDSNTNFLNRDQNKEHNHNFESKDDIPEKDIPHDKSNKQLLESSKSFINDQHIDIISIPDIYTENHNEKSTYEIKDNHDKNIKSNVLTSSEYTTPELLADTITTSKNQDKNNSISFEYHTEQSPPNTEVMNNVGGIPTNNENYNLIESTTHGKDIHTEQPIYSESYDSQITYNEETEQTPYEDMPNDEENAEDIAKVDYLNENELNPVQILSPNENIQTNNEKSIGEVQPSNYLTDNAPELTAMESVQNCSSYELNKNNMQQNELELITATDQVKLQETSQYSANLENEGNIDNDDLVNHDKLETTYEQNSQPHDGPVEVDNTGIKEFNAEHNEMFYSEQANVDYNYDQNAPDNSHVEDYQQNEQYKYYEGEYQNDVQINEHVETTQRYDQNYEQQYAEYNRDTHDYTTEQYDPNQQAYDPNQQAYDPNQQAYDPNQQAFDPNQQAYDPNQQAYDPQYNTQQEYDTQALIEQQNYETQELVEQDLNNEDGFNIAETDIQQAVQDASLTEKASREILP